MIFLSPRTADKAEESQEALLDAGAPAGAGMTETEHAAMVSTSLPHLAWMSCARQKYKCRYATLQLWVPYKSCQSQCGSSSEWSVS